MMMQLNQQYAIRAESGTYNYANILESQLQNTKTIKQYGK